MRWFILMSGSIAPVWINDCPVRVYQVGQFFQNDSQPWDIMLETYQVFDEEAVKR